MSSHLIIFLSGFIITLILPALVLLLLPEDYLIRQNGQSKNGNSKKSILIVIVLNMLGILILIAGIIMLFTPGQGLLTMALGVLLTSLPGKQKALRYILSDNVLKRVNSLRARFGRSALKT